MSAIIPSLTHRKGAPASSHHARAQTWRPAGGTPFLRWCSRCSARSRQRQALAQLDYHDLKDIGMTREQANAEVAKPFWKK